MVSDDEKSSRPARSVSDNDLIRQPKKDALSRPVAAAVDNGIRAKRHHSSAIPVLEVLGGAGYKTPKPPSRGKKTKSTRGLFFRSSTPKTQDGESPLVAAGPDGEIPLAVAASVAKKALRPEST